MTSLLFFFVIFTMGIIENKTKEDLYMMYERKTEIDEELDLKCKIHRFEDKLLRSKNYTEQEKLRVLLMKMRTDLQKLQWKKAERGSYC